MNCSHVILELSKKTRINVVKTKPDTNGKWSKYYTSGSMAPFSHLLWFTYELYMITATLLKGNLYTEGFIIALL